MKLWPLIFLFTGLCAFGQTTTIRISTNTPLTQGDQVVWSGSAWVPLNKGTNGQVLTMSGTNVTWATPEPSSGSGTGLVTSVSVDFEVDAGELSITNALGTGPLVRQSAASGVGTVTSVAGASTVSGLGFSGPPITGSGTLTLTGTVAAASIDSAIARLASPALTDSPTAPTASPGTSNTVLATTAFVLQNAGTGGGGDAYLANSQTFTGASNTFSGALRVYGEFYTATQTVDVLNIGSLSLGTNIVGLANGGTSATNAAGARAALSLVPGTDIQAWDADLDDLADGSLNGSKVGTGIDDDFVAFDDADNLWTAAFIGPALEELNDSINAGVPNGSGAKVHWSQLLGVPAGFADGSDDGSGGGSGTMTGIAFATAAGLPFAWSPASTTTTNTFTLSASNQTANLIFAGPSSGGAAAPTFRALVDDDVPNTITASNYQPLDADLTSMAAGTVVATAQTNAVSLGAPTLIVGSTNVAVAIAAKAPIASPAFSTSATIGGTNVLDYASSHLTEAEASALYHRTNAILTQLQGLTGGTAGQIITATGAGTFALSNAPSGGGSWDGTPIASGTITNLTTQSITYRGRRLLNPMNGDFWADGHFKAVAGSATFYPLAWNAMAGGSLNGGDGTANHPITQSIYSSASADSGGHFRGDLTDLLIGGGETAIGIMQISRTNGVILREGFHDGTSSTEPTDGAWIEMANGFVFGRTASNSSRSSTTTSNQVVQSTWYTFVSEVNSAASTVTFTQYDDSGSVVWTDTLSANIPTGSGRHTTRNCMSYIPGGGSFTLLLIDGLGVLNQRALTRYP